MRYDFNAPEITKHIISWVRDYFVRRQYERAVIGISGGRDSAVSAALISKAIGSSRVFGFYLPDGEPYDRDDAFKVAAILGVSIEEISIRSVTESIEAILSDTSVDSGYINRVRSMVLYHKAAELGEAAVVCTSNLTEIVLGNFIKWADSVGDLSPLDNLTSTEVGLIGKQLGLPNWICDKQPAADIRYTDKDGNIRQGITDEKRLGISIDKTDSTIRGVKEVEFTVEENSQLMNSINRSNRQKPVLSPCPIPLELIYDFSS